LFVDSIQLKSEHQKCKLKLLQSYPNRMIERCNAILRIFRIKFNEEKQRLVRLKFISKNAQLMAHAAEAETEAFDRSHLRRVETIKFN
jgi:uncharacterized membrane protein YqjE